MKLNGNQLFILAAIAVIIIAAVLIHQGRENWKQQVIADHALWAAVESRDTAAAEKAIERGAQANDPGDAGRHERHPLITAQAKKDAKMVDFLLAHGANPSFALIKASNVSETQGLLRLGAQVNGVTDDAGMTPLAVQASSGRPGIVQILLAHGADPTARDEDGYTVLERTRYAAANHPRQAAAYSQVIRLLTEAQQKKRKADDSNATPH